VERALWVSAGLTAVLAALAALRRHAGGTLESGSAGAALLGLEIVLGALLVFSGGARYFGRAVQSVLHGRVDRFTLIAAGLTATFVHGVVGTWAPPALLATGASTRVHALPSLALAGAMLTLLLLGDWLERCEGMSILAPARPGGAGQSLARAPFVPALNQLSRLLLWLAVVVAAGSFAGWAVWGPEPRAGYALLSALSSLIAACPAALGLVAPLAVRAAMDRAPQAGFHFRGVEEIELLRRVDTVLLDASSGLHPLMGAMDVEAVRNLHRDSIRVILLTADDRMYAEAAARRLGIEDVRAELSHRERAEQLRTLRAGGRTLALLCGGNEDAAVAREAHLIVAAGGRGWAPGVNPGVRLRSESQAMSDLVRARRLSRSTVANIKENITITFVSSLLAVPLAAGALFPWYGMHAGPLAAALSCGISAAAVILNSLRLRYSRF
jgi:cation transport ATPase